MNNLLMLRRSMMECNDHEVLLQLNDFVLDGTNYFNTGINLFELGNWTLDVTIEWASQTVNQATVLACNNENGRPYMGFTVRRRNSSSSIAASANVKGSAGLADTYIRYNCEVGQQYRFVITNKKDLKMFQIETDSELYSTNYESIDYNGPLVIGDGYKTSNNTWLNRKFVGKIVNLTLSRFYSDATIPQVPEAYVEYLESDGKQFIDTGISFQVGDKFEIEVCNTTNQFAQNKGYGNDDAATNNLATICGGLRYISSKTQMYFGDQNVDFGISNQKVQPFKWFKEGFEELKFTDFVATLYDFDEDVLYTSTPVTSSLTTLETHSIYLFRDVKQGDPKSGKKRIRSVKLWRNNILVMDLAPCRVGNTGYMYDKVRNIMLPNLGSGKFTFGNDI